MRTWPDSLMTVSPSPPAQSLCRAQSLTQSSCAGLLPPSLTVGEALALTGSPPPPHPSDSPHSTSAADDSTQFSDFLLSSHLHAPTLRLVFTPHLVALTFEHVPGFPEGQHVRLFVGAETTAGEAVEALVEELAVKKFVVQGHKSARVEYCIQARNEDGGASALPSFRSPRAQLTLLFRSHPHALYTDPHPRPPPGAAPWRRPALLRDVHRLADLAQEGGHGRARAPRRRRRRFDDDVDRRWPSPRHHEPGRRRLAAEQPLRWALRRGRGRAVSGGRARCGVERQGGRRGHAQGRQGRRRRVGGGGGGGDGHDPLERRRPVPPLGPVYRLDRTRAVGLDAAVAVCTPDQPHRRRARRALVGREPALLKLHARAAALGDPARGAGRARGGRGERGGPADRARAAHGASVSPVLLLDHLRTTS